ncbi:hypothetical protein BHE74_00000729 [Ensete ventricosum]|nr:hypothetical protein BHE74_00000729 [Ensete ventricosum]
MSLHTSSPVVLFTASGARTLPSQPPPPPLSASIYSRVRRPTLAALELTNLRRLAVLYSLAFLPHSSTSLFSKSVSLVLSARPNPPKVSRRTPPSLPPICKTKTKHPLKRN